MKIVITDMYKECLKIGQLSLPADPDTGGFSLLTGVQPQYFLRSGELREHQRHYFGKKLSV